jgi:hypothetical protein
MESYLDIAKKFKGIFVGIMCRILPRHCKANLKALFNFHDSIIVVNAAFLFFETSKLWA